MTAAPVPTIWPAPEMDIDVQKTGAALRSAYRLPLDRRFVLAFSLLSEVLFGGQPPPVRATFEGDAWEIRQGQTSVGTLSEFAGFEEALALLSSRAKASEVELPPGAAHVVKLDGFQAPFGSIASVDLEWSAGTRDLAHVRTAARGLALATLQVHDPLAAGDAIPARALALLAILRAHGERAPYETALLAEAMGYSADATAAAVQLAGTDPLRSYVLRDDATLEALCRKPDDMSAFLWSRRLADLDDGARFEALQRSQTTPGIPLFALATSIGFGTSRQASQALLGQSFRDAGTWAGESDASIASALGAGFLAARFAEWIDRSPTKVGALVGPEPRRAYLRASFHAGAFGMVMHSADRLGSQQAVDADLQFLGSVQSGSEAVLLTTLSTIARDLAPPNAALVEELHATLALTSASGMAASRLYHKFASGTPDGSLWRSGLKALARRLDTRPSNREQMNDKLYPTGFTSVMEPMLSAQALQAPGRYPNSERWYALRRRDVKALERLAATPGGRPSARVHTYVAMLEGDLGEAASHRARIDAILALHPEDWAAAEAASDYLIDANELKLARKILDRTLRVLTTRKLGDTGLDEFSARAKIGELALAEGRCADGWRIVEPGLESMHGGVLSRGAYLLACMGRRDEALALVDRHEKRYPGANAQVVAARAYWLLNDYEAAGRLLDAKQTDLVRHWHPLANVFFRDHKRKSAKTRLAAFQKLAQSGLPWDGVTAFAFREFSSGKADVAFEYLMVREMKGSPYLVRSVRGYVYLRKAKGDAVALDWVRAALKAGPTDVSPTRMDAFFLTNGVPELVNLINGDVVPPDDLSGVHQWGMRAISAARKGPPYPEPLREYLLGAPMNEDIATARYLIDLDMPLEQVFELTRKASDGSMGALAYHLGIKAEILSRHDEAAIWYAMSVELAPRSQAVVSASNSRQTLASWLEDPPRAPVARKAPPAKPKRAR